jgi:hypothetical protein
MGLRNKIILDHINRIVWGIIWGTVLLGGIFTLVIILNSVIRGDKLEPGQKYGPSHNYEVPIKSDDIMEDIDMDCGGSDEYQMWIGSDGDTIWE